MAALCFRFLRFFFFCVLSIALTKIMFTHCIDRADQELLQN